MNLSTYDAPHIRHSETTRGLMGDAILTMLIIYAMAFYYYGTRAVMLLAVSVLTSVAADALCVLMAGKRPNIRDYSAIITGMILPLILPASTDYWIVAAAAVFAIVAVKHPFGGTGHNVFNPAAAGFAFIAICFEDKVFTYPLPLERIPLFSRIESIAGISPAFTMGLGGVPNYDAIDIALGNFPGPMGATNIVVILTCLLYLVSRNTVRWTTPLCFFATAAVFAFLFPRIGGISNSGIDTRLQSVFLEMTSGMLLFGGVFMLGDPVTTPKRERSKAAFAVTAGIAAMLFRRYGHFEETFPFAVLLMNATVWGFDMAGERLASITRRKKLEGIDRQKIQKKASGS